LAKVALPRYTRPKELKDGKLAYFWEPPHWARPPAQRNGRLCPLRACPLGSDIGDAWKKAEALNVGLDEWRRGDIGTSTAAPGSVRWLFSWYQKQRKFTKNAAKTQSDYRKIMEAVASLPMRVGEFGQRTAAMVDAEAADKVYDKFAPRGARQALYVVQVCRAVWNVAVRYSAQTGVTSNPWAAMGVSYKAEEGNRPTSRAEYHRYCAKARELGFESMATAASLSFELVQRVWDVFAIPDPDIEGTKPKDRGLKWEDYRPGHSMTVIQSKTGKRITIPLVEHLPDGEKLALYPELEAQLARVWKPGVSGVIVLEERNAKPYQHRRMSDVHRTICDAAGLPKKMTFTGFRHGGATEIGDAGEPDIRPISGHTTLDTAAIYDKITQEKARRIALRRREHIETIEGDGAQDQESGDA